MNVEEMLRHLYLEVANIDEAVLVLQRLAAKSAKAKKRSPAAAARLSAKKGQSRLAAVGRSAHHPINGTDPAVPR